MPRRPVESVAAGTLCVIGGAEDRVGERVVLGEFVRLAGGAGARIAVVATASALGPEILEAYDDVFRSLGAAETVPVRPHTRAEADDPALGELLDDVDGIFMTGGNQLILAGVVASTRLGVAMQAAYARGAVVGGTSAGASAVSEHMVAFGDEGDTPRQGQAGLAAGLGLLRGVVVDQHFDQRTRYGRLLSLVARSPSLLGVGVDEDTAAVIRGERVLDVVGSGCVFVVDGSQAQSDAHIAEHGAPLLVSGAVVHTLPAGSRFDLRDRCLLSFEETHLARQLRHEPEEDS
ncbi:MAG: cyanophycinase [Actinomycetes bacterium]